LGAAKIGIFGFLKKKIKGIKPGYSGYLQMLIIKPFGGVGLYARQTAQSDPFGSLSILK
jgi:hypothetical protein